VSLHSQRAILLRGDPGLFDIFKKIIKVGAGVATGGAIGGITAAFFPRGRSAGQPIQRHGPVQTFPPVADIQVPLPGIQARIQRFLPGGATGTAAPGCPKGFHPNRSDYYTAAGFVARESKCVRNRRRNLSNGRANTRSLRRMAAWEKQDKKRRTVLKAIARSAN